MALSNLSRIFLLIIDYLWIENTTDSLHGNAASFWETAARIRAPRIGAALHREGPNPKQAANQTPIRQRHSVHPGDWPQQSPPSSHAKIFEGQQRTTCRRTPI